MPLSNKHERYKKVNKNFQPYRLKSLYESGENISQWLKNNKLENTPPEQAIELSYDLQTGSYISLQEEEHIIAHYEPYTEKLSQIIQEICPEMESLMEAGVGEATTLCRTLKHLNFDKPAWAMDLSWSRMAYGKRWLKKHDFNKVHCFTGDMCKMPIASNSIDVIYTSHAVEPNGGREKAILMELVRVAKSYVIMLEPSYELANNEAKQRMEKHGFCKNLAGIATDCGFKVLTHELYPYAVNPLNPTALTVIEKTKSNDLSTCDQTLVCPQYHTPLQELDGFLYSEQSLIAYPILGGIPCLRSENAIIASRYPEFIGQEEP